MPLSASQRIKLLTEISDRLQMEEWPLIDLTLSQFGLPTSEEWPGNKNAYVIQMCKGGKDSLLIELAQHVGFLIEEVPKPGIDPPFWRKRMFRLFVSHLSMEKVFAAQLQEALLGYGISGFVAHNDIEPTLEWQTQIETALATADSLVALLHPAFHASNWTDQEIGFAMGRGLPVFSVRFGQDPYGFIGRFQGFVGGGKTPAALARELFDAYRKNKQTQKRMGEVLLNLFEDSSSFVAARERIGYSSLSYLKLYQIDKLKIDQSFVRQLGRDANDGAIVRAIINMAHGLGFRTIAEGVETQSQLDYLRAQGCDEMQGYFFAHPVPAEEFAHLLRSGGVLDGIESSDRID